MTDLLCPVVVGRGRERELIWSALERVRDGRGSTVVLEGEAGVGKSRLARDAAALAKAEGMVVLVGRAVRRNAPLPYRPLTDALLPAVGTVRREALGPFDRAFDVVVTTEGPKTNERDEREALAAGEAVARFLRAAGPSCLLLLEDLHWADLETLAVVEYLADRIGTEPIALVATLRSGEPSPAADLVADLGARRAATLVELGRLDATEVDEMLSECLRSEPPPELAAFVRERADGVPFVVEELLAGLAASGAIERAGGGWLVHELVATVPSTFADTVRGRLERLDTDARRVALAAALLGRDFDWTLLPEVTGLDEGPVLAALRACVDGQLLAVAGPQRFRFRHALGRDAVAAESMPPERARLAARGLDAVERVHPSLDGEWCDVACELAEVAGDGARAATLALEGARRALERGALGSAEAACHRARGLASGDAALALACDEVLVRTWAASGRVDDAIAKGRDTLAALAVTGAPDDRRAMLHLSLARAAVAAGHWDDARTHVAETHALAPQRDDLRMRAAVLGAHVAIAQGRPDEALALADEALALADEAIERATRTDAPAVACEAYEIVGRVYRGSDISRAADAFERARALAERHGLPAWRARALHELGTIDLFTTPRPDRFLEAREAAEEAGAPSIVALADLHLAVVGHALWRPAEGITAAERCVDLSRRLGLVTLPMGLIHLGSNLAMLGDERAMDRACADALDVAGGALDVVAGVPGRCRFTLSLRRGDLDSARGHLDDAIAILEADPSMTFPFRGVWALLHTVAGTPEQAVVRRRAATEAGAAGRFNSLMVELADAVVCGREGRAEEALARYGASDPVEALPGARPWSAIVQRVVSGPALRDGWGEPVAWLLDALAAFEDEDLPELASSCRALLREAGAKVPRRGRGEADVPPGLRAAGVTSREVDVLRLVVERLSNREIAARLHLSPRTVEHHVASLLTKTGAPDRGELASIAVREGVAET